MKIFLQIFVLVLITQTGFSQNLFLEEASKKWQSASDYTQKVMKAMPEKHYGFKPMKDEMSFEEQLLHMANNMNWLGGKFLSDKTPPTSEKLEPKGKSRKEIVQTLNASLAYIQDILNTFDASKLDEKVPFPAGELTKRQIIILLNDHQTHHRAQLLVYLRLKDEKPPKYVGW
jgi:uncharacterized damage-inducible protein DinB